MPESKSLPEQIYLLSRNLQPLLNGLNNVGQMLNRAMLQFLVEHQETIELWGRLAEAYTKIEPYLNRIRLSLNDPEFKDIANDIISLSHVVDAIDLQTDPDSFSILRIIADQSFQSSVITCFSQLNLNQSRIGVFREAFDLHNQGAYGGSTCLLYSLIEGVLTEAICNAGFAVVKDGKVYNIANKKILVGLGTKISLLKEEEPRLFEYFKKMEAFDMIFGDLNSKVVLVRNSIMHGSCFVFNEKMSGQLILWLYSMLLQLVVLENHQE